MRIQTFFAGLALALVAYAGAASAAVQFGVVTGEGGSTTLDQPMNAGDGAIIFGGRLGGGSITHQVFLADGNGTKGFVTATDNALSGPLGTPIFDITDLSYQVFDAMTNAAVSGVVAASNLLTFVATPGTAYYVLFTGTASGLFGGNYTANIAITPIPGAILLLAPALAGLGFIGLRRRKTA